METLNDPDAFYNWFGSYRTYEEWKHIITVHILPILHRSYRTYEEWKLINNWYDVDYGDKFLPYL